MKSAGTRWKQGDKVSGLRRQLLTGGYLLRTATAMLLVPFPLFSPAQQVTQPAKGTTLDQRFRSAVAAYEAGRLSEAAAGMEEIERQLPGSFEVHELLGLVYGAQSYDLKAVEQLKQAARLEPRSTLAKSNLATALVHAGRLEEAKAEWQRALALEPQDYNANHDLAELYLHEGKIADALPLLEVAQRSRPEASSNGYDLALAYLLQQRNNEARNLIQVLQKEKDSGELHVLLGRVDENDGEFLGAAAEFASAAHMDPSEENLFTWASELLLHRAYEAAIDVFREATQRYPASPRMWIGLGMGLYSRGEYEPAIRSLLSAADLDPSDSRCYLFLSKAYLSSTTQIEAVIDRFRRYALSQPNNARAQYYYAMSLWKGRRIEHPDVDYRAVEGLLNRSIALDDFYADAHLQLGILYNDERAYAKSLPEYERALQLDPNLADAHFRIARYYSRAGEKDKAKAEFAVFTKLHTQHQAELDKERTEVQQFVVSNKIAPAVQP